MECLIYLMAQILIIITCLCKMFLLSNEEILLPVLVHLLLFCLGNLVLFLFNFCIFVTLIQRIIKNWLEMRGRIGEDGIGMWLEPDLNSPTQVPSWSGCQFLCMTAISLMMLKSWGHLWWHHIKFLDQKWTQIFGTLSETLHIELMQSCHQVTSLW